MSEKPLAVVPRLGEQLAGVYKRFSLAAAPQQAEEDSTAVVQEQALPVRQQAAVRAPLPLLRNTCLCSCSGFIWTIFRGFTPYPSFSVFFPADLHLSSVPTSLADIRIHLKFLCVVDKSP